MKDLQQLLQLAKNPHYQMSEQEQRELHQARGKAPRETGEQRNVKNKNVVNKHSPDVDMHKPGMDTVQPDQVTLSGGSDK